MLKSRHEVSKKFKRRNNFFNGGNRRASESKRKSNCLHARRRYPCRMDGVGDEEVAVVREEREPGGEEEGMRREDILEKDKCIVEVNKFLDTSVGAHVYG